MGDSAQILSRIRLYPIKSLNPIEVSEARIGPAGGLESDRVWAIHASDGRWVNGKRTAAVDKLRARFTEGMDSVELSARDIQSGLSSSTFAFPQDVAGAAEWLSRFFCEPVTVRYAEAGFPDDVLAPGPTVVSTASLDAVCKWFPGISLDGARLRFRTSLEINGMEPFGEDRLFASDPGSTLTFSIGKVTFQGSNPCARCPVPPRDPFTGISIAEFQKRFSDLRRQELPSWAPAGRFDHFYRFATNTRVPASEVGKAIHVGDLLVC
jgi:uncharacterized protein YcbX